VDDDRKPCPECAILVRELEKRIDQRFKDNQRDAERTETELHRRLEEMNEFRAQISNERLEYMRKEEYEHRHSAVEEKLTQTENRILAVIAVNSARIASIEKWQSKWMGGAAMLILLAGFIGATIGLIWGGHSVPLSDLYIHPK